MRQIGILLVFVFLLVVSQSANAQQVKRPKFFEPDRSEKFQIVGSLVVEYQPNTQEVDGGFSIDLFKKENRDFFVARKIKDETFGGTQIHPVGKTIKMLIVRPKSDLYRTADALQFVKTKNGQLPSLDWVLMAMKQHGTFSNGPVAIFTERKVFSREGFPLVPFISEKNVWLVSSSHPWKGNEFIFMVDDTTETETEANATVTSID